jgi:TPR repeat protein
VAEELRSPLSDHRGILKDSCAQPTPERSDNNRRPDREESNLALMLYCGDGVDRDLTAAAARDESDAATWFARAAERGNALAQYQLGQSYEFGRGVSTDIFEALKWYELSAENSCREARERRDALARAMAMSEPELASHPGQ